MIQGGSSEASASLKRSDERYRVLLEINNAIISNLDRDSLFQAIAVALRKTLTFDRISITLLDPGLETLSVYALSSPSPVKDGVPLGTKLPRKGSRVGWVLDNKRPLLSPDMAKEELLSPAERNLIQQGILSTLVAPLIVKGRVLGTLNLGSRVLRGFDDEDAEYLEEVARQVALSVENMKAYKEIADLKARLEQENLYLQEEIKTRDGMGEILGEDPAIEKLLKAIQQVAPTDSTVLISGDTGTGKELVARAVHGLSHRSEKPLVTVNCVALPAGLIESELFGHEKGAFTGALSRKIGRFEMANGGTVFLDEVGDLPMELQAKLLRVLQEGEFERVGGTDSIRSDVRVIAATNRSLEKAIEEGRFRSDLYYRLNVFPIRVPSLGERRRDIDVLARHFVLRFSSRIGKRFDRISPSAMAALRAYSWPGNVRELQNVIERAVILSPGPELELGEWLTKPKGLEDEQTDSAFLPLEEVQRRHIIQALEITGGRVSGDQGAALLLGMKPTTLQARMKKLGIERKR